jgi:hypothetical protein
MHVFRTWRFAPALALPCLMAACGGPAAETGALNDEVTLTGCLRGGQEAGTYVVTPDSDGMALVGGRATTGGAMPTYTYVLVADRALASLVGQEVQVTGTVEETDEFAQERSTESEQSDRETAGDESVTPTVEVEEQVEVRLRELVVRDVRSVNQSCTGETGR